MTLPVNQKFLDAMARTPAQIYERTTLKGDVGIELELEGEGPLGTACKGWQVHQENSLRGPGGIGHGGCEYVTAGPVSIENVIPAVEALAAKLTKDGVRVNPNAHRSSTHIHVNVQNMSMTDVFGYITAFTCVEPMMLALCGERRDGNSFCASSYETGDLPEYFNNVFKSMESDGYPGDHQRGKYASLSTFRLHDLGTLEARIFPQSIDPQEIYMWCRWLLNIRDIVKAETDKSFRQLVKLGLHNPEILIGRVFTLGNPDFLLTAGLQRELVQYGSQEAYELTRLFKRYMTKKPTEKKKKPTKIGLRIDTEQMARFARATGFGRPQAPVAPVVDDLIRWDNPEEQF